MNESFDNTIGFIYVLSCQNIRPQQRWGGHPHPLGVAGVWCRFSFRCYSQSVGYQPYSIVDTHSHQSSVSKKSVWRKKRIPMSGATDVVFSSVRSFVFIPHFAFKEFNDNWKTRNQSNGVVASSSPDGCRDQTAIVWHMPGVGTWYTFNSRRIQAGIGGPNRTTLTPLIMLANQNGSLRGRIWRISKTDHSFFMRHGIACFSAKKRSEASRNCPHGLARPYFFHV